MDSDRIEMLEESYRNILELLCEVKLSNQQLEQIKSKFKDCINSRRRYENIRNMNGLLKVLEKRCVIEYDNIRKLYDIVEEVDDAYKQKLGERLNTQALLLSKTPTTPIELSFYSDNETCFELPDFFLPIEVMGYISEHVNRYWKNFARSLQIIQEKEIDMIEDHNGNKTRKCLEIYIQQVNDRKLSNPHATLLRALEMIQRRDIKEHVESLLNSSFKEVENRRFYSSS